MKKVFISFVILIGTFFLSAVSADTSVCQLPKNSCVGSGCSFRVCEAGNRSFEFSVLPFTIPVPEDLCIQSERPFGVISKLPVAITLDLRTPPSPHLSDAVGNPNRDPSPPTSTSNYNFANGDTDCLTEPALARANYNLPGTVVMSYRRWVTRTPPNCAPGVGPGQTVTTYPSATGNPCTPVVSTCSTTGTGLFDIPLRPFSTCSAVTPIAGVCGSANGTAATVAPSGAGLCSAGTSTAVAGAGPWTWSCSGQNGGTNASCATTAVAPPAATDCTTISRSISRFNEGPPHTNPPACSGFNPPVARINSLSNFNNQEIRGIVDLMLAQGRISAAEHTAVTTTFLNPRVGTNCTTVASARGEISTCVLSFTNLTITYFGSIDSTIHGTCGASYPYSGRVSLRYCQPAPVTANRCIYDYQPPPPAQFDPRARILANGVCQALVSVYGSLGSNFLVPISVPRTNSGYPVYCCRSSCGTAHKSGRATQPTLQDELCGTNASRASGMSGGPPWTWTCIGHDPVTAINCTTAP